MSKIPVSAPSEVQQSFREVWESLDPFLRTNINLSGRRFINAGNARAGGDYVTQRQVTDKFGFEAFYDELKKRGLDGFPGRLAEPQDAVAAEYPDPPPTTHAIGQIYYDPVSEQLKIVTDAGIIVLTTGSPLTAESGSGNVARLDGTGEFTGDRTISGVWTFTQNLNISSTLPQIKLEDTSAGEEDFYIKVNADVLWVAAGAVQVFDCSASNFRVWKPAYFDSHIDINGVLYNWPAASAAGVLTNDSVGNLTWSPAISSFAGLSDTDISSPTDHDSIYFDSASGDWKNTANFKIKDSGGLATSGDTNIWLSVAATVSGGAGLLATAGSQEWIIYGNSTTLYLKDQTAGLNALTIAGSTGSTAITTVAAATPLSVIGTAATCLSVFSTSAVNGQAGIAVTNDARTYTIFIDSADRLALRDETAGTHRLYINTDGSIVLNNNTTVNALLTLEHTAPRLTFTDTTASAHDAYLEMNFDIFRIIVEGNTPVTCGTTYAALWLDVTIAGAGKKLGFFGGTRVVKQEVTGSRGANAALASLLTALATCGLITDSST